MADIFLAYKREDLPMVQALARELEGRGYSVFYDWSLPPGRTFDQVIQESILAAKAIVAVWTAESQRSVWVVEEAAFASREGRLIEVMADDSSPPIGFGRGAIPMQRWFKNGDRAPLEELLKKLERVAPSARPAAGPVWSPNTLWRLFFGARSGAVTPPKTPPGAPVGRLPATPPVFISHASADGADAALAIVRQLEQRNIPCWVAPRDVSPGKFFAGQIVEAIESSRGVIVLVSSGANGSPHVLAELTTAQEARRLIIPVRVQNITPSPDLRYFTGSRHGLDWFRNQNGTVEALATAFPL